MKIPSWLAPAMALAGYDFAENLSEQTKMLVFSNGKPGGNLAFPSPVEAYEWIEGFVMLSDNDELNATFEKIMRTKRSVLLCENCIFYEEPPKYAIRDGNEGCKICRHPNLDFDTECGDHWIWMKPDGFCSEGRPKPDFKEA